MPSPWRGWGCPWRGTSFSTSGRSYVSKQYFLVQYLVLFVQVTLLNVNKGAGRHHGRWSHRCCGSRSTRSFGKRSLKQLYHVSYSIVEVIFCRRGVSRNHGARKAPAHSNDSCPRAGVVPGFEVDVIEMKKQCFVNQNQQQQLLGKQTLYFTFAISSFLSRQAKKGDYWGCVGQVGWEGSWKNAPPTCPKNNSGTTKTLTFVGETNPQRRIVKQYCTRNKEMAHSLLGIISSTFFKCFAWLF